LPPIKEVSACAAKFGALSIENDIFTWSSDFLEKIEGKAESNLSVGANFGHVIDHLGRLHVWGNFDNKKTQDRRPKLQLVDSLSKFKCLDVYSGGQFAFGIFE